MVEWRRIVYRRGMEDNQRQILLIGVPLDGAAAYQEELEKADFSVTIEEDAEKALARLLDQPYVAIVSHFPLITGQLGAILDALRRSDGPNYGTGLVLLAERDRLRAAAGLVGRGVNKALSLAEGPTVLRIVLERLIEVSQPMALRLPVAIEVTAISGRNQADWTTENLSGSGMLIGTDDPPDVGTTFRMTLALPEGDVEGEAIVVRRTFEGRESVDGFGARFIGFQDDGQVRLLRFLRKSAPEIP